MDKEFFQGRIKQLTDDNLIDLLQKTSNKSNPDIFELVKDELERRHIRLELIDQADKTEVERKLNDKEKLRKWNWGAFILAPIWTLANKLEVWTFLCFVPVVNIVAAFYLGFNGNRLAFEKSKIESVDDFMVIQKDWELWGVRLFWLSVLGVLVTLIVCIVTS